MSQVISKILLISHLLVCGSCQDNRVAELERDIRSLRQELRELAQLQYDIESLRTKVSKRAELTETMPAQSNEGTDDKTAIFAQVLTSSGSHKDDPFLGPGDADVVLMAFGDFQCLPCMAFLNHALPEIKKEFIETKRLKFIYRDYPLASKKYSKKAAQIAHCAGEQGAYWRMFDALFKNQELLDQGDFKELVSKVENLDVAKLMKCAGSTRYERELLLDQEEARQLGARGAPSFFIARKSNNNSEDEKYTGIFIRGAQPYPVVREQILRILGND
jgi:protein-disulfide isomerase